MLHLLKLIDYLENLISPQGQLIRNLEIVTGGKWAGWVINGLGHKWVGCVIIHLSIYDPFIYKLIIHYPPNPFN